MSSISKSITLRILVPRPLSQRTLTSLAPLGKVDSEEVVLNTARLTTDTIVQHIKDYSKLRDETGQTIRQLGIQRRPESSSLEISNFDTAYSRLESQSAAVRIEYQKALSEAENVDRQVQEVEKQISTVDQLKMTGFNYVDMLSRVTAFRRILGRLPTKKLDAAQRAVSSLLKDRAVMTTGAKRNDWVYLLVATPTEEASQTLQALLLYDFIPTDMPAIDGPNLDDAQASWQTKKKDLTLQKQSIQSRVDGLKSKVAGPLNKSLDTIEETLLLLKGSLRLGEGTHSAHMFAILDKVPPPQVLTALQRDGIVEMD